MKPNKITGKEVKGMDKKIEVKKQEKTAESLDMEDIENMIFGRGLTREDVELILLHILDLVPSEHVSKTCHKNFLRAMITLIVYVHHLDHNLSTQLESMVDKNTGYVDSFEFLKPLSKDVKYVALLKELFDKATSLRASLMFHPTFEEVKNWSGNMHNYICVTLKALFVKEGFCDTWNEFLISIGIDMEALTNGTK